MMTYGEFVDQYEELRKSLFNSHSEWDWEMYEEYMKDLEEEYPEFYYKWEKEYLKNK